MTSLINEYTKLKMAQDLDSMRKYIKGETEMQRMTLEEQIAFLTELKANPDAEVECIPVYGSDNWSRSVQPRLPNFHDFRYRIRPKLKTIWVNEYSSSYAGHPKKEHAQVAGDLSQAIRTAVRYIEWPEGYELRRIEA